jgi:peptide/nickel transport system substrate-binding protein
MPADPARARRLRPLAALALVGVLAGCTVTTTPEPSPSPTATARPFTVVLTGKVRTLDPAIATSEVDSILVTSIYQRLMQVPSGSDGQLKPDAASDCVFVSRLVYECTLPDSLYFANGDVLDSEDVKFSIQRALRFNTTGTSVGLLGSLSRIETPDSHTVRFVLSRPDNQFGYALAGQAASIVDSEVFDPDTPLDLDALPNGSGPYQLPEAAEAEGATLHKYTRYAGPDPGALDQVALLVVPDSATAESAIADGKVDVAWDCLDSAAQQRIDNEIAGDGGATASGFTRVPLPGVKVTRLYWSTASRHRGDTALRQGVAKALQADRTLVSIIPQGVAEQVKSFPVGGRPELPKLKASRIHLTLGYDSADPGQADVARMLRDRIEELDGVSVRVVEGADADLVLTTRPAWVNNALGWLQLYLDAPLAASKVKLAMLSDHVRTATDDARLADLSELQQQAATDVTVLPVSQGPGLLLVGKGVKIGSNSYGTGQQLGLWGFSRG